MVLLGSFSGDYQDDVDTGQGSDVATDLESIRTVMNGLLDDANIKPGAAINQSKVAGLTTAVAKLDSAHQGENHTGDVTSAGLVTTIATNAVTETKIGALAVTETKIAANAVTEAKIGALAVTNGKIGANVVTEGKIASNAVSETKIATNAVTEAKIAALAVTEAKIADGAVTETKIAANVVTETKIAANAVTGPKLASASVTNAKILDSAIENAKLAGMPTATLKGRIAAGTGAPENLTAAQAATLLGIWQVAGVYSTQLQTFNAPEVIEFQNAASGGSGHGITIDTTNWRLTVSLAGVYLLTFDCEVPSDLSNITIRARINGMNVSSAAYGPATFPLGMLHVHFLLPLLANDYVDMFIEPGGFGGINHVHYTLLRVA